MTTKLNRRVLFGLLLLLLTTTIVVGVRIASEQPSPTQKTYTFGEATLFFETDRTTVWQIGDCVNLRWDAQNILMPRWANDDYFGQEQLCPTQSGCVGSGTLTYQGSIVQPDSI